MVLRQNEQTLLEVAQLYHQRGWTPLPVPFRSKNPNFEGWQNFKVTEPDLPHHFNGLQQNIGVLLGEPSGNLVDIDIDSPEVMAIASYFLPATPAVFGRVSKPQSHFIFRANIKTEKFTDPLKAGAKDKTERGKAMLCEIRSTGTQTIFPGSVHNSGEAITWSASGEPAPVEAGLLRDSVRKLAAASLLARYWPRGARHEAALALAGGLLRAGWAESEAQRFIEAVCVACGDEESTDRVRAVCSSLRQLEGSGQVTGWPTLANLMGAQVIKAVRKWLQLTQTEGSWKSYRGARIEGGPRSGRIGHALVIPSQWFAEKFPSLADEYGEAILEGTDKHGVMSVRDIGEDFLAAVLSDKGSPDTPTVFIPTEQKFFTYSPTDGIYVLQREPVIVAKLSNLLLECVQHCRGNGCETQALEFRLRAAAKLAGVVRKARGVLETPEDFFKSDLTEFIPVANGMLRLRDKVLLPFSPSYRRRNKLAVPYDPAAKCSLFLGTLMRPALEPDDLDLLQRWCGLALIGENLAQVIIILIGTPGGGKGVFIRVLNGIIGPNNLASLRPHLLGERFEVGRFLGKTLLYGADVPENFLTQRGASVLKSLVGADPVTLEFKNSNERPSIICRFNVIVTCNSRLTVHLEGDTDAWRRRLGIIDYHKPKPQKVIADLDQQILNTEASGVLNWMLEGLDKLRSDGWQLSLNETQQDSVDNLLLESDGHNWFVREQLEKHADCELTVDECFAAYVEYCNERGWAALTHNKFGHVIRDCVVRQHGLTTRNDIAGANGKAQRGWRGLRLREGNP